VADFAQDHAIIEVGKKKIMVSHYPLMKPPEELLPTENLRRVGYRQMNQLAQVPDDVDMVVYAHTHYSGAFRDQATGKLVVNVGTLTDYKDALEQKSFIIYEESADHVSFFDGEHGKLKTSMKLLSKGDHCLEMILRSLK
jgi:predicted phosphodiesterase